MFKKEYFSLRYSQKKVKIEIKILLRAIKISHHVPTSQSAYTLVLKKIPT